MEDGGRWWRANAAGRWWEVGGELSQRSDDLQGSPLQSLHKAVEIPASSGSSSLKLVLIIGRINGAGPWRAEVGLGRRGRLVEGGGMVGKGRSGGGRR
jgi:hypothetical protein